MSDRTETGGEPTLSREELDRVLERRRQTGETLGRCLTALGWEKESDGLKAVAAALGIRCVDLAETRVDPAAAPCVVWVRLTPRRAHLYAVSGNLIAG